jgi:hypothetical protein
VELVSAFVSLLVASVTAFTCTDYIRSFASLINVKQAILIFIEFSLNFSLSFSLLAFLILHDIYVNPDN